MRRILTLALLALMLTGCKSISDYKPDTIVQIPLHPTQSPTEGATETATVPAQTEPVTEAAVPTEPVTQPPKTNTGSGSRPSGGKKPGRGSTDSKIPATQPPTQPLTEPPTEAPAAYDPAGYVSGNLDRAVADAVNNMRQAEGLAPLAWDDGLCAVASVRARELAVTWSNARPDGRPGTTVLAEYGWNCAAAAENLYFGPPDAAAMVDKWMSSGPRRANILTEAADTIGVGSYTSNEGITFVAVLFVG